MKKSLLNAVLLLIASSQMMSSAQDAAKPATTKPLEKAAASAPASTPADKKSETKPDTKAETKKPDDKKVEEKKSTNRLPSNYGKLGLTDAQKAKVYGVQEKHEKEIDSLTEKLKSAKSKRDTEIESLLTPAQKKMLKEIASAKESEKEEASEKK